MNSVDCILQKLEGMPSVEASIECDFHLLRNSQFLDHLCLARSIPRLESRERMQQEVRWMKSNSQDEFHLRRVFRERQSNLALHR